jgi:hypothetical protein
MSDTIPGCDASEAYEIVSHRPGFLGDFWTVICNGIPVRHYPAKSKALAEGSGLSAKSDRKEALGTRHPTKP